MLCGLKISEIDISSQNWEVGYVCNLFCSAYPVAMADGVERATALQCDKIDSLDNVITHKQRLRLIGSNHHVFGRCYDYHKLRPEMMRFPDPRISDEVIGNSSESNMATSSEMLKAFEMG